MAARVVFFGISARRCPGIEGPARSVLFPVAPQIGSLRLWHQKCVLWIDRRRYGVDHIEEVEVAVVPTRPPIVSAARVQNERLRLGRACGVMFVIVPKTPKIFQSELRRRLSV